MTEHLAAFIENLATSPNLFNGMNTVMEDLDISWSNDISCMMDNCAVMRECNGGVERLIERKNKHLLDIHGDTIHIVNNAAKELLKPFNEYVQNTADNIFYDIQKQPKGKEYFHMLCEQINYSGPKSIVRHISSRFLQTQQVADRLLQLQEALQVYYYSFLPADDKKKYR